MFHQGGLAEDRRWLHTKGRCCCCCCCSCSCSCSCCCCCCWCCCCCCCCVFLLRFQIYYILCSGHDPVLRYIIYQLSFMLNFIYISRGFCFAVCAVGDVLLNRVPPWHEYHLSVFHAGKLYKYRSLESI